MSEDLDSLFQDVRYGLRMLAKNPGFTAVAVLTLALGIGANTAIFTLINAVMLKELPVKKPEQLVLLGAADGTFTGNTSQVGKWGAYSCPLYEQLRDHNNDHFQGLAAFGSFTHIVRVAINGAPAEQATGNLVSGNYFTLLGVEPVLGRTLAPADDNPSAPPAAIISYQYWTQKFSQDPSIVGHVLDVNGTLVTIVGVAPPEFFGVRIEGSAIDFWFPLSLQSQVMMRQSYLELASTSWLNVVGRLRSGPDIREAQAALTVQLQQFLASNWGSKVSAEVQRLIARDYIELTPGSKGLSALRNHFSQSLLVLMAIVGLVLLIACANVATLLLARATVRQKEISVRVAVGASQTRLIRQLLTESVLLALSGGAAGLLFAAWGTSVLVKLVTYSSFVTPLSLSPDFRVLTFSLAVSVATGIFFGFAPAVHATRVDLVSTLKESPGISAVGTKGIARLGLARGLVVGQVALSLPLLVAAGLFVRSLVKLEKQDMGFNRDHVLEVVVDPLLGGYKPTQLPSLYRQLEDHISALPGVRSASLSLSGLLGETISGWDIAVQGYTPRGGEDMDVEYNLVGLRYLETVGIPLLLGRAIGPEDSETSGKVAMVNETMARHFFSGQTPIGQHFGIGSAPKEWIQIVGVVKDARYDDLRSKTPYFVYLPLAQHVMFAGDLEVRAMGSPTSIAAEVRRGIAEVDRNLPILKVTTLENRVVESAGEARLTAQLSSFFGVVALLLACVGLYGVVAYGVARRMNEIGVRMALGAERRDVLWMILREALSLVGVGLAVGLPVALAAGRLVSSQLFGLRPSDPATFTLATLSLVAVAALAGYIPARRATRVDPMVALRYE